jgi:hypothetical protein
MYVQPSTPLTVGGVLDDAIKLYRASFRYCWRVSLLGSVFTAVMSLWMMMQSDGVTASIASGFMSGLMPTPDKIGSLLRSYQGIGKLYLLDGLVWALVFSALFAQMAAIHRSRAPLPLGELLSVALRRLPGMIAGSVIFAVAIWIGTILLIVPGMYLWGKLELWAAAAFDDDAGAIDGLGRSWNMTVGNWWRTVTIISIALIIILVLEFAVSLVTLAIAGGPLAFAHPNVGASLFLIPQLISAVVSTLIRPMYSAIFLTTYHDAKLRRTGGDLLARANALT